MHRRDFIKQGCFACMAMGAGLTIASLSSCAPLTMVRGAVMDSKISFSAACFTAEVKMVLLRAASLEQDILVIKHPGGTYTALYMECTHNKYRLSPASNTIHCHAHGAQFDLEGNATKGPAEKKLKSFVVTSESDIITVHLG